MSICAWCGQPYSDYLTHQCPMSKQIQQRVNPTPSQQNPYEHTGYVYPPGIPPYVTDILEALKRIEDLLREGKK